MLVAVTQPISQWYFGPKYVVSDQLMLSTSQTHTSDTLRRVFNETWSESTYSGALLSWVSDCRFMPCNQCLVLLSARFPRQYLLIVHCLVHCRMQRRVPHTGTRCISQCATPCYRIQPPNPPSTTPHPMYPLITFSSIRAHSLTNLRNDSPGRCNNFMTKMMACSSDYAAFFYSYQFRLYPGMRRFLNH